MWGDKAGRVGVIWQEVCTKIICTASIQFLTCEHKKIMKNTPGTSCTVCQKCFCRVFVGTPNVLVLTHSVSSCSGANFFLSCYCTPMCRFGHNAKIVHFAGAAKPWSSPRGDSHLMEHFVSLWWKEYYWNDNHTTLSAPKTQQQPVKTPQITVCPQTVTYSGACVGTKAWSP